MDTFIDQSNQLIKNLGLKLGDQDLNFDEENVCSLYLNEEFLFLLERDPQESVLLLSLVLGPLPATNREEILFHLLSANFYWELSAGGTFTIDEDNEVVVLMKKLSARQLEVEALMEHIEGLCTTGTYYWNKLKATTNDTATSPSLSALQFSRV